MQTYVDTDDEEEQRAGGEVNCVDVDGCESAQTHNGESVEGDEYARYQGHGKEQEHDDVYRIECRHWQAPPKERTEIGTLEPQVDAAEDEKGAAQILMHGLRRQQTVWQKEHEERDEDKEQRAHQLWYPNPSSQTARRCFVSVASSRTVLPRMHIPGSTSAPLA